MHPIFEALETPPPRIGEDKAAAFLARHYDLAGELSPLSSERDQNFLVRLTDGSQFVVKFANVAEPASVTDFQNQALLHLARVGVDFPVPRVVPASSGEYLLRISGEQGKAHSARLLTWLDGVPLQQARGVDNVAAPTGTCLAELGLALRDFEHSASDYPLLWDIRNAGHLEELLPYVSDRELRRLCEARVAHFESDVRPVLDTLRMQVIHNDLNPSNMLVSADDVNRLAGVIDFGDMVYSQLVNDVAVAAAYFCRLEEDPYLEVVDFLGAYTATVPLTSTEIEILPDMILTRHLTTVMITHWRASLYPKNRDYILRNEKRARNMLRKVAGLPVDATRARFRSVCRSVPDSEVSA